MSCGEACMTRIKICGLRRIEDAAYVNEVHPDYAGFILAPGFWRCITKEQARALRGHIDTRIKCVGVFFNQEISRVAELLDEGIIDMAQLHGQEDETYIRQLKTLTDKPVIKAFKITGRQDVLHAESSSADIILLDGGTGSGQAFDWNVLSGVKRPYILAGGLHPGNVQRAVSVLHPWGVDVSSGVETDRIKDAEKIRSFVSSVRAVDE